MDKKILLDGLKEWLIRGKGKEPVVLIRKDEALAEVQKRGKLFLKDISDLGIPEEVMIVIKAHLYHHFSVSESKEGEK